MHFLSLREFSHDLFQGLLIEKIGEQTLQGIMGEVLLVHQRDSLATVMSLECDVLLLDVNEDVAQELEDVHSDVHLGGKRRNIPLNNILLK